MRSSPPIRRWLTGLLPWLALAGCVPDAPPARRVTAAYLRIVAAEDARPAEGPQLDYLIDSAEQENVFLRRMAVRALGRLENPDLADAISDHLDDPSAPVRTAAAHALAQAFRTAPGHSAMAPLLARAEVEEDATVRGTLARSLGRLRLPVDERRTVAGILLAMSRSDGRDAPLPTLTGVMLGLESLVRAAPDAVSTNEPLVSRMEALATYQGDYFLAPENVRIRTLALSVLGQAGRLTREDVQRALVDEAPLAPGVAMRFYGPLSPLVKPEILRRAMASPSLYSVIEAFRNLGQEPREDLNCRYLFAGARQPTGDAPRRIPTPIRVVALDALGERCEDLGNQRLVLRDVVDALDVDSVTWQPSAHALVSLARIFPRDATDFLPRYARDPNPFVRAYAAQAAGAIGNRTVLRTLASDSVANVRTAAITALFSLQGHGADDALLAQLDQDDPQLLLTVAGLLEGTPSAIPTANALVATFERVSAARRENFRDPRRAILERLGEVGGPRLSERLAPFLKDYDARVAEDVATLLEKWDGRPHAAQPQPLPHAPLPTIADLGAMESASVVLHMQGGGDIVIELLPYLATTNTYRFYRQVREGYFDGLTFHRWSPNFVIQGGSPNANEYRGSARYSRDEVGLQPHWRGTVGISTRGHDTGDGQIFVNLMDNVRLDDMYTIVGRVTEGMDVVDQVLEGAVIERAEVRPAS